jgi:hypothetical protein
MFGSKRSITDRVKESLTDYLDVKFEDYRGQIASDLAKGIGALAGLVALWSVIIIAVMFLSISIALVLGWALSFFMESFAYALSFLLISIVLITIAAYIIKYKEKYIVTPVFNLMSKTLRTTMGLDEDNNEPLLQEDMETTPVKEEPKTPVTYNDLDPELEPHSIKTKTPPPTLEKEDI